MQSIRLVPVAAVIAALAASTPADAKSKRVTAARVQAVQQAVRALPAPVVQQIVPIVTQSVAEIRPVVTAAQAAERPLTPGEIATIREVRSDAREAINDVLQANNLPELPVRPVRARPD